MKDSVKQRDTRQRRLVYNSVINRFDHPSADDIYNEVRQYDSKISMATVYRNLRLLSQNGEILHISLPGADRFDSTIRNHYHIICSECGKVIDAPVDYFSESDTAVEKETGFQIKCHTAFFEGICPECRGKTKL